LQTQRICFHDARLWEFNSVRNVCLPISVDTDGARTLVGSERYCYKWRRVRQGVIAILYDPNEWLCICQMILLVGSSDIVLMFSASFSLFDWIRVLRMVYVHVHGTCTCTCIQHLSLFLTTFTCAWHNCRIELNNKTRIVLCFVDHASTHNLVNKAKLVHKFS